MERLPRELHVELKLAVFGFGTLNDRCLYSIHVYTTIRRPTQMFVTIYEYNIVVVLEKDKPMEWLG